MHGPPTKTKGPNPNEGGAWDFLLPPTPKPKNDMIGMVQAVHENCHGIPK